MHPPPAPSQIGEPVAPLLDPSTTYAFAETEDFAQASAAKVGEGYVYARWANPTVDAFEAAVADLEGTEAAEASASGMASIAGVFFSHCGAGDRIVATQQLYGNSYSLLAQRLPLYGITADFADVNDYDALTKLVEGARLLYCETIGNPRIQAADIERLADIASGAGIPLVVDNTFASPALCRPVEHGASIVLHSATKFLGGHHDLMGGVVCGAVETIEKLRAVARDLGPVLSPFNAWLALRGMMTLPLRVERSNTSAQAVAEHLSDRDDIDAVLYPGLRGDFSWPVAERLFGGRGGGTLAFEVAGGRDRAARFQNALRVILPAASLGGTHSLLVHAASVTHTQLSEEERASAGITEGLCRLSIGLEDPGDLIADLDSALDAA